MLGLGAGPAADLAPLCDPSELIAYGPLLSDYGAGLVLSLLALRMTRWSEIRIPIVTVTAFTVLTTVSTFVHMHRLHLETGGRLMHEEHAPITLPKGWYRVIRQREYVPGAVRVVAD